jgi:hypothetical protein
LAWLEHLSEWSEIFIALKFSFQNQKRRKAFFLVPAIRPIEIRAPNMFAHNQGDQTSL